MNKKLLECDLDYEEWNVYHKELIETSPPQQYPCIVIWDTQKNLYEYVYQNDFHYETRIPYHVTYENGNGYSCQCCRNTWTVTDIEFFKSNEDAAKFAEDYNKKHDYNEKDSIIKSIYKLETETPIYER